MKKILSFFAVPAIMASASLASYIPPTYVLRVETVKPGLLRLTNTSTQPIYVKSFILRNHTVNELGKRTGEVDKILVDVNAAIAPGHSVLESIDKYPYRTTAHTELVQWNERRKVHRDGLLICFINDFNHNVFVTPNGHLPCPK
ncbi:MAG: hypothetical protein JGK17_20985 [Microcoleus sp. PH2017_10_PVI_O_A]|uniref:hypothetical protein n=1 Tax=unclassified Microcoleus TaxID=2642155 RepID=UPI001DA857E3|nr:MULTISPECIES: hypothetical protein [unclassified Microcoleus]TAE79669.1 MAG: hypothetical protein EAZ83_20440 [Oscillatoriales cyanobacterium]MCC3408016.1 hypothetical protein [Microcoleus sp. PH2017_10_PVI_O_A]MCC3460110.1 hypothetical protein [Microcoleus sp. PH2017_11_PCY_U_A]MCC3480158.1 hypothetical protein [Microcoleus sp. PH2017_12_PCY_D_A]MCC3528007.1 hypothetical protein [Microcoleus sp. PH2017_21_RUC_O_A]